MDVTNIPNKLSRKCVGAAERMLANLGDLKQAPPLTVAQVRILHALLHGQGTSDWDRAFAGYCLLCLYDVLDNLTSARWHTWTWMEKVVMATW